MKTNENKVVASPFAPAVPNQELERALRTLAKENDRNAAGYADRQHLLGMIAKDPRFKHLAYDAKRVASEECEFELARAKERDRMAREAGTAAAATPATHGELLAAVAVLEGEVRATEKLLDKARAEAAEREKRMTMATRHDPMTQLGEAYEETLVKCAEKHGLDLHDPRARTLAEGYARDTAAAKAVAAEYRTPRESTAAAVKQFTESADAIDLAVAVLCREKNLDNTSAPDRAIAFSEMANDPRYRHLVPDYAASSIGHDGRARR